MRIVALAALLPLVAAGCVSTATTIVKAPFQVAGKAVDLATTSPSERDRNYIRKQRKAQEREDRERRAWARRCRGHEDEPQCRDYTGFKAAEVR